MVPVLPGVSTNPPPWMAVSAHLVERLRAIGLPPPGVEVIAEHLHVNLVVVVHGKRVRVPAAIGFDDRGGLAEIHTHDHSGTIHLEAKRDRGFTLGMVFAVWGVRSTPDCLGTECASGDDRVRVFVNGEGPVPGDPTALPLQDEQVVVVTFGTPDGVPDPLPARFVYGGDPEPA